MGDFFISTSELAASIGTAAAPVIVDTRRRAVFDSAERMLPTARWREHSAARTWTLPPDLPIVVYCAHGHNVSQFAAAELRAAGFDARVLSGGIAEWEAAGRPTIARSALPCRDEVLPSRWVTRIRPKIDRIACPWLITRFIDREARFTFVEPSQVLEVARESGSIAFDVEGAPFAHDGPLCSFDLLIRGFGLSDPHLDALAAIVRGADTDTLDLAPEAAGLLAVSLGISVLAGGDDHAALARGFPVYDALFAWHKLAAAETHNWPLTRARGGNA